MPSPVMTSEAAAASPTSSTRPVGQAAPDRRGPGSATPGGDLDTARPVRARRGRGAGRAVRPTAASSPGLAPGRPVAQHAEPDVGPTTRQRERPRVPRQQIGVEPHVEVVGRRALDLVDVRPEGVPLAQVPRPANPAALRTGLHIPSAPMTYRAVDRRERRRPRRPRRGRPAGPSRPSKPCPRPRRRRPWRPGRRAPRRAAGGARRRRTCRRRAAAARDLAARRRAEHGAVDDLPVVHRTTGRSRGPSSSRRASVVSPSPQHLSRGNRALSTTVTSVRPGRASSPPPRPPVRHRRRRRRSCRPPPLHGRWATELPSAPECGLVSGPRSRRGAAH